MVVGSNLTSHSILEKGLAMHIKCLGVVDNCNSAALSAHFSTAGL